MAGEAKREGQEDSGNRSDNSEPTVIDHIKAIAAYNARAPLTSELQLTLFLKSWWSTTYNRPLKDPVLASYSLEELLYEFYDKIERQKAAQERLAQEDVKIEEAKEKEVLDWAEEEEKKELAEMQRLADQGSQDPLKDPENIKWMREQIVKAKEQFGNSFGEDIVENFEED